MPHGNFYAIIFISMVILQVSLDSGIAIDLVILNIEVDERSTTQLPRITYMQTPITKERSKKIWRLEFLDTKLRHS